MKRVLALIVFFLFIFSVRSNSIKSNSYSVRTLYFSNLSTKNINDYFSDVSIIRIYPHINPAYIDRTGVVSYRIGGGSLSDEISTFREKYLSFIRRNNYLDYNYLYMNGIGIDKMDVYINDAIMDELNDSDLVFYVK